jgi:hypothetical protein
MKYQPGAENKICISKHQNSAYSQIASTNDFFKPNTKYTVRFDGAKIIVRVAPFDHKGRTYSAYHTTGAWTTFAVSFIIPHGHYKIDEDESNQDQIVIYLEDKI